MIEGQEIWVSYREGTNKFKATIVAVGEQFSCVRYEAIAKNEIVSNCRVFHTTISLENKEVKLGDTLYYNNKQGVSFIGTVIDLDFNSVVPRIALNKATNGNVDKCWIFADTNYLTRTIKIGNYDVPEPLRDVQEEGTLCFVTSLVTYSQDVTIKFESCETHKKLLSDGILHLTKEAAELHAKALLSFTTMGG